MLEELGSGATARFVIGKRPYAVRLNEGSCMKAEPMTPAVDILAGRISQMEPIVRL